MNKLSRLAHIFYKKAEERPLEPEDAQILKTADEIADTINRLFQSNQEYYSKKYFNLYPEFSAHVADINPKEAWVSVETTPEVPMSLKSELEAEINKAIQNFGYTAIL